MIVQRLRLTNFRSHKEYTLECKNETSLILGPNGCGKTSVLEAVYEAMRGKSFRAVDREIVRRGEEYYRVELDYEDGEKVVVVYEVGSNQKTFLVGDKKWRRLPKKYRYPVVLFLPDDLHLVGASPAQKRDYFDRLLAEMDEKYSNSLSRYNKALRQRNELLKTDNCRPEMVFSWNVMLAQYGCELRRGRRALVEGLNERITTTYQGIAENEDMVELIYRVQGGLEDLGGMEESESRYLVELERGFEKDCIIKHTSYGAHRDGFNFIFNGVEADGSASRGETRSMVIAMKFIEAEMILGRTGRRPVVLLDDVFSELDMKRQECLVRNFKDNQVILTSVEAMGYSEQ